MRQTLFQLSTRQYVDKRRARSETLSQIFVVIVFAVDAVAVAVVVVVAVTVNATRNKRRKIEFKSTTDFVVLNFRLLINLVNFFLNESVCGLCIFYICGSQI